MRKAGLALALVASTQLTLLSSPAFAADPPPAAPADSAAAPAPAAPATAATASSDTNADAKSDKSSTGWILMGVGGAVAIGGIIVDVVAANTGSLAGAGGKGDNGNTDNSRTDLYFVGTSMIVAGLVAGLYGGSLIWGSGKAADPKPVDRPVDDANAKPDGVGKAVQARLQSVPSFTLPLVSATF